MEPVLAELGDEVDDAEQETAVAFALAGNGRDLGMLDAKATSVDIEVAGRDYSIMQSPSLLHSARDGGTTGAVVWRTALTLAEWLAGRENPLFARGILTPASQIVELGCGVNPLLALALNGRVARYIATDQAYVLKLYRANLDENTSTASAAVSRSSKPRETQTRIETFRLDWEVQDVARQPPWHDASHPDDSADVVIACDCVYNEHLVGPFVQTCAAICKLRTDKTGSPTILLIAQQLRAPDVYEEWIRQMLQIFRIWKVQYDGQSEAVSEEKGFAVHAAVLRGTDGV